MACGACGGSAASRVRDALRAYLSAVLEILLRCFHLGAGHDHGRVSGSGVLLRFEARERTKTLESMAAGMMAPVRALVLLS